MKLIGAGLPRTATTTQWIALKTLGVPTYHMKDMMADMERGVALWRRAYNGEQPWNEVFDGFQATVDDGDKDSQPGNQHGCQADPGTEQGRIEP